MTTANHEGFFLKLSEKSSGSYWMNSGRSGSPQSDFPFPLVPEASMNGVDGIPMGHGGAPEGQECVEFRHNPVLEPEMHF